MVKIIIGGCFQGKLDYAKQTYPEYAFFDEKNDRLLLETAAEADKWKEQGVVWNHVNLSIRELLNQGKNAKQITALLEQAEDRCKELVLLCDEIGNGIVPMEKEERSYREETGRIMTAMAKKAVRVERVICGMVQVLK